MAETVLNKEAGWKALTGTTNFGTIATSSPDKDEKHYQQNKLAFDLFVDRICGFVGSYYVTLQGHVDALVFAGGIGEKSDRLRKAVVTQCACLGFDIDDARNETTDEEEVGKVVREVSKKQQQQQQQRHRVLVCQTDEQYEMAHAAAADPALWQAAAPGGSGDEGKAPELSMLKVKNDSYGD